MKLLPVVLILISSIVVSTMHAMEMPDGHYSHEYSNQASTAEETSVPKRQRYNALLQRPPKIVHHEYAPLHMNQHIADLYGAINHLLDCAAYACKNNGYHEEHVQILKIQKAITLTRVIKVGINLPWRKTYQTLRILAENITRTNEPFATTYIKPIMATYQKLDDAITRAKRPPTPKGPSKAEFLAQLKMTEEDDSSLFEKGSSLDTHHKQLIQLLKKGAAGLRKNQHTDAAKELASACEYATAGFFDQVSTIVEQLLQYALSDLIHQTYIIPIARACDALIMEMQAPQPPAVPVPEIVRTTLAALFVQLQQAEIFLNEHECPQAAQKVHELPARVLCMLSPHALEEIIGALDSDVLGLIHSTAFFNEFIRNHYEPIKAYLQTLTAVL